MRFVFGFVGLFGIGPSPICNALSESESVSRPDSEADVAYEKEEAAAGDPKDVERPFRDPFGIEEELGTFDDNESSSTAAVTLTVKASVLCGESTSLMLPEEPARVACSSRAKPDELLPCECDL